MKRLIAAAALATLAGCATFSPDGGIDTVRAAVKDRGLKEEIRWIKTGQDAGQANAAVKRRHS